MRIAPAALASMLLVAPGVARASGLSVARFGAEHGHPMTTTAPAIFYNPAGIAGSEGGHLYGDLVLAWRRATYDRATSDTVVPPGADGTNTGRATLFNVLAEPFVGATYRLGNLALGAAFYVPFGGQNSWSSNDKFRNSTQFPGAVDGVQRWYTIEGALRSMYFSAAAAYAFGPVAVGVSVNAIDTVVNTVQARTSSGDDDVRNEGRAWLDARTLNFSMGAGATYDAIPKKLRFGLSYQSRPGFGGGIEATGTLHTVFAGRASTTKVAFTSDLPDIVRAGALYRPVKEVELRLFGDYQHWSVIQHQCIVRQGSPCDVAPDGSENSGNEVLLNFVRDWHDTFGIRAGASYFPTPERRLEVMGGAGYASKAIPSSTLEPALLDFDAITASAGMAFDIVERLRLATSYTEVFYLSRDTTGQSIHGTLQSPSRSPDSGGKYSLAVGFLNVNLDFAF